MKLPYKLQQFWLRKGMWEWTFNAWQNLMFPHLCYGNYDYTDPYDMEQTQFDIDAFWYFLNGNKL